MTNLNLGQQILLSSFHAKLDIFDFMSVISGIRLRLQKQSFMWHFFKHKKVWNICLFRQSASIKWELYQRYFLKSWRNFGSIYTPV